LRFRISGNAELPVRAREDIDCVDLREEPVRDDVRDRCCDCELSDALSDSGVDEFELPDSLLRS
jgi:hypothetical protein